jgi:hypothetical protein
MTISSKSTIFLPGRPLQPLSSRTTGRLNANEAKDANDLSGEMSQRRTMLPQRRIHLPPCPKLKLIQQMQRIPMKPMKLGNPADPGDLLKSMSPNGPAHARSRSLAHPRTASVPLRKRGFPPKIGYLLLPFLTRKGDFLPG